SIEGAVAALHLRREGAAAVSFDADMNGDFPVIIRRTLERHTIETNEAKRNGRYVSRFHRALDAAHGTGTRSAQVRESG
ncbi:unnamed protein product, partial [Ectocarpus sp. 13 AM-2016]